MPRVRREVMWVFNGTGGAGYSTASTYAGPCLPRRRTDRQP